MARRRILRGRLNRQLERTLDKLAKDKSLPPEHRKLAAAAAVDRKAPTALEDGIEERHPVTAPLLVNGGDDRPILNWLWEHRAEILAMLLHLFA